VFEAGESQAEVARDLDVHPGAVRAWVHHWRHENRDQAPPRPVDAARVSELEDEVGALRAENDFLKKARAFFVTRSESRSDVR
jgi:transposase